MLIIMIITASLSLTTCRLQAVSQCEVVLVGGLSVKMGSRGFSLMTMSMISGYCRRKQKENAVEPRSTDTRLIWISVYNSQFCLFRRRKGSYTLYKINLLNTDPRLMRTLCMSCGSSVEPIELPSCFTSCLLIAYPGGWSLSHSPVVELPKRESACILW